MVLLSFLFNLLNTATCYLAMFIVNFDIVDLDAYDRYFREESTMTLPEAGRFYGVDGIREYVSFVHPVSPYILEGPIPIAEMRSYQGYESGQCKFISVMEQSFKLNEATTSRSSDLNVLFMVNLLLDVNDAWGFGLFGSKFVKNINVFYPKVCMESNKGGLLR